MERVLVKNPEGVIVGELTPDGPGFDVWRRERLRYPARRRRVHVGKSGTLDEGRAMLLSMPQPAPRGSRKSDA